MDRYTNTSHTPHRTPHTTPHPPPPPPPPPQRPQRNGNGNAPQQGPERMGLGMFPVCRIDRTKNIVQPLHIRIYSNSYMHTFQHDEERDRKREKERTKHTVDINTRIKSNNHQEFRKTEKTDINTDKGESKDKEEEEAKNNRPFVINVKRRREGKTDRDRQRQTGKETLRQKGQTKNR